MGTGVFVSLAIGARLAGVWIAAALLLAGALAACNALSSAQLAAAHPVSGGTYEYGYRLIAPSAGFSAGWMFILAKSASAATAALGFGGYVLGLVDVSSIPTRTLALLAVAALTICVLSGIRRSTVLNAALVCATLLALACFVGLAIVSGGGEVRTGRAFPGPLPFFEACALMFVAYTGYGRIATLGEEIANPRRTIPRAIALTITLSVAVYVAVALAGVAGAGSDAFLTSGAPLESASSAMGSESVALIVASGAMLAMLGVLLNLVLGLSRVALAMGRRGDLPRVFSKVHNGTPVVAVAGVSLVIGSLALVGDVKTTWSFSAFTVLVYYAITNACALRLSPDDRLYPRWISWLGLFGCLSLAFFVEIHIWLVGLGLLALGLLCHVARQR